MTQRVLKSYRNKMGVTYMQSSKQCALPVITTMVLWQLVNSSTWAHDLGLHIGGISDSKSVTV